MSSTKQISESTKQISETAKQIPEINSNVDSRISRIKYFALDMDGTVYLGTQWIDGALDFLKKVEETGRKYVFLTNNSSKGPLDYVSKLAKMGLEVGTDRIITSGDATIAYLKKNYPGKKVYLLGNSLLRRQFADAGIELAADDVKLAADYAAYRQNKMDDRSGTPKPSDENSIKDTSDTKPAPEPFIYEASDKNTAKLPAEVVVTAFDTELDYRKMCIACDYVRAGLPYITTHPDFNCPTENGFIPDSGAIIAFIEASTGRRPDVVIGKPGAGIAQYLLDKTGAKPEEIAMVGDRLYTDVATGVNNGLTGILVLSGEAGMKDVETSDVTPHLIFDSVKDIIEYL